MAFGLPAQHTVHFSVGAGPSVDLRGALKAGLHALGWSIRQESNQTIVASATVSLFSWGEKITIHFLPNGSVSVTSACAFPLQIFDWGKTSKMSTALCMQ
jgi:hypothetical protein